MLPNTPEMFEAHFGVPMTGAVLNTLNTRLDAEAIAFMLEHGEAKVLITDREFAPTVARGAGAARAASRWSSTSTTRSTTGRRAPAATTDYEAFLAGGDPRLRLAAARRTSGRRSRSTTPRAPPAIPKGVVYHHRGAYLNAHRQHPRLGHAARTRSTCGRCRCSTATAGASPGRWRRTPAPTSACARSRPALIFDSIREHRVTHYCGAPIVHTLLHQRAGRSCAQGIDHKVQRHGRRRGAAGGDDRGHGAAWASTSRTSTA